MIFIIKNEFNYNRYVGGIKKSTFQSKVLEFMLRNEQMLSQ